MGSVTVDPFGEPHGNSALATPCVKSQGTQSWLDLAFAEQEKNQRLNTKMIRLHQIVLKFLPCFWWDLLLDIENRHWNGSLKHVGNDLAMPSLAEVEVQADIRIFEAGRYGGTSRWTKLIIGKPKLNYHVHSGKHQILVGCHWCQPVVDSWQPHILGSYSYSCIFLLAIRWQYITIDHDHRYRRLQLFTFIHCWSWGVIGHDLLLRISIHQ